MKNTSLFRRLLSVVLVLAMVGSLMVPAAVAETTRPGASTTELELIPMDPGELESHKLGKTESDDLSATKEEHTPTDVVRVSIVLEKAATLQAGFETKGIASNASAKAYREGLRTEQDAMTAKIEKAIGCTLDVKWNLTLAVNIISADIQYGQIETIKALDGVQDVFLENYYESIPDEENPNDPMMASSSYMTGANYTWAAGLTGAGSRLAILDTGVDIKHKSFDGDALEYALRKNAEDKGMSYEAYLESLNLLTVEKIDAVKDQLNANKNGDFDASKAYYSVKIPFMFHYYRGGFDYDATHENDMAGHHGSHVAGISAANRFVKVGDDFRAALDEVLTQGVAPDAQILDMDVFEVTGGCYDSSYMAAIEDAIILGCDSANLSLGSSASGFGFSPAYEAVMNELVEKDMVCAIAMGNAYMWYDYPQYIPNDNMYGGYIYADDVTFHTGGSPGTFTNSLAVASVDNAGKTDMTIKFGDLDVLYIEASGYGNDSIKTLAGGELQYIFFENTGVDGDGNDLLAPYAEAIQGKVVLCQRGDSSFFQKVNAAAAAGAVGVVIYNNAATLTGGMNLTGVTTNIPAVIIDQADGMAIRDQSEAVKDTEENVLYYTGTMEVMTSPSVIMPETINDTVEISGFSSYGVPGTLVLKPEILAPGGNIYSVYGYSKAPNDATSDHVSYGNMSGTSMATPQVNGMAGVLAQYIRENDLCAKTGLTQRQLINSLLMSTAHPVYDSNGAYWPVIRVGAGLANVADAVAAKSYILMDEDATLFPDSARDGKVKAELGDDPGRTGEYEFSFTLYPMEGSKKFTLRTDLFIQNLAGNAGYGMLQSTGTASISDVLAKFKIEDPGFTCAYVVDGLECDGTEAITIDKPTQITVKLQLTDYAMYVFDALYNAPYIQGYTFVEPVADGEGAFNDVIHSIPILGVYGSWTDSAMMDRSSVIDAAYGTGMLPYLNNSDINYMTLKDADGETTVYMGNPYMLEQKFPIERLAMRSDASVQSFVYLPIRNAKEVGFAVTNAEGKVLSSKIDDGVYAPFFDPSSASWKNTTASKFNVGMLLSKAGVQEGDVVTVGFYALPEYVAIAEAKRNGNVSEDGVLGNAGFKSALEAGLIGDGAAIKYTVTVDDTAPVVLGALQDLVTGDITIKCSDNNYIAYVAAMNKSGSQVYFKTVPEQTKAGETVEVPLTFETKPNNIVILIADYAGNETAYQVELGGSGNANEYGGAMIGFTGTDCKPGSGDRALQLDPEKLYYNHGTGEYDGLEVFSSVNASVRAAEYVDGYVFMAANDGWFYIAKIDALDEAERLGQMAGYVYDMAYNYADRTLYALGEGNVIYSVDLATGEMTQAAELSITNSYSGDQAYLAGLAIDNAGNFYGVSAGGYGGVFLYSWRPEDLIVPERDVNLDGVTDEADAQAILDKVTGKLDAEAPFDAEVADVDKDSIISSKDAYILLTSGELTLNPVKENNVVGAYFYGKGGCLAWDHNTDTLYMAANFDGEEPDYDHDLFVIDVETGEGTKANNENTPYNATFLVALNGLFIVPDGVVDAEPTDVATSITAEPRELDLLKGQVIEVNAIVLPWNLSDKSVVWASKDETVVKVSGDGVVTAVGVGNTVITATAVAKDKDGKELTDEINVKVSMPPEVELRGVIWDEVGAGMASVFKTNHTQDWEGKAEVGELYWGTRIGDQVFGSDSDNFVCFDADTYELTKLAAIDYIPSDAAPLPEDMVEVLGGTMLAPTFGTWLIIHDPENPTYQGWNLASYFAEDPMVTIAFIGNTYSIDWVNNVFEVVRLYVVMTESGALYTITVNSSGKVEVGKAGETGLNLAGASNPAEKNVWASMIYDDSMLTEEELEERYGYLYVSVYNGEDNLAHLYAIDCEDIRRCVEVGDFREGVWPAVSLYQYEPLTDLFLAVSPASVAMEPGKTAEIKVRIKMGETNDFTFEVKDPEVCSFNPETKVITGLKVGTTDVVITTVDTNKAGEKLSETVHVTVLPVPVDPGTYPEPNPEITGVKTLFGFEQDPAQDGWTFLDRDMDGYNWTWAEGQVTPYDGASMMMSNSYVNGGGALTPDNWAFSPAMDLSAYEDANFAFYAKGQDAKYSGEVFAVYAGTSTYIGDMTKISADFTATGEWTKYVASLKDFAGQKEVYVAIRHYDVTDMFALDVDNAMLLTADGEPEPEPQPIEPKASVQAASKIVESGKKFNGVDVQRLFATSASYEISELGDLTVDNGKVDTRAASGEVSKDGEITVTLTEEDEVTNGMMVVKYDPEVLTFVNADSEIKLNSINPETGVITFAFASEEAVEAKKVLATLKFAYATVHAETDIFVTTYERGANVSIREDPVIVHLHDCKITNFTDIDAYPYGTEEHDAIEWAYTHKPCAVTAGTSESTFGPEEIVTRAQVMTFLWAAAGKPSDFEMPDVTFSDVTEGDYWYTPVMWAYSKGITAGNGDGTFGASTPCARAHILQFFYAAQGKPALTGENHFSDVGDDWFAPGANWAYEKGIELGEDGKFNPWTPCTRVNAIVYLYRYYSQFVEND